MTLFRRIFYLLYYIKESDLRQLWKFLRYSSDQTSRSKLSIALNTVFSAFRYNISFKDYFCFGFFEPGRTDHDEWAGTGFMYEYQLRMNPRESRKILENKILFLDHYRDLIKRRVMAIYGKPEEPQAIASMLRNPSGRLVLKGSLGQTGAEVEVIQIDRYSPESLLAYMKRKRYDLVEEYVTQHHALNELSPSGLNTVRVITQLDDDEVFIVGARLRITVNSAVDNMAAGNLAATIDTESGVVEGPAVFSDITKRPLAVHPVTGMAINGFKVPHWNEVLKLADTAARRAAGNKSVGWDIAVTETGPELIEGNHNWCKLLWQLPVKKGLKKELVKYL